MSRRTATWRRRLVRTLAILLALSVLSVLALSIVYSPTYAFRVVVWQGADVDDYRRFPARPIDPSPQPRAIPSAPDACLEQAIATGLGADDPAEALTALGTQAFLIVRDGLLVYEGYFGGHDAASTVTSFSVAKSFMSTLFGLAIEQGSIESLDQPITEYLPELAERDAQFRDITIRHLLTMSSGLRYEERSLPWGDDAKTYYWPDLRDLALNWTVVEEPPGGRFHYNNYNLLLEGMILERATGMSVSDFLSANLWQPMGGGPSASWSLDSPGGFEKSESGINGAAIDFARFGLLMLERGQVNGIEVIPAAWVDEATTPVGSSQAAWYPQSMASRGIGYGLHWWTAISSGGDDFSALGNHGQYVYVAPDTNTVIVRHGRRYGINSLDWFSTFHELARACIES